MSETVKVSKINIEIGDKTVKLTLVEAQELQSILNEMFGVGEQSIIVMPGYVPYPVYPHPFPRRYWEVTWCNTTSAGTAVDSGEYEVTYSLSG